MPPEKRSSLRSLILNGASDSAAVLIADYYRDLGVGS
jgi:hypothetical protein